MKTLSQIFSEYAKNEMRSRGLRQTRVSQQIGITQAGLSQLLNGKRRWNVEVAGRVADALGLTLGEMVTRAQAAQRPGPTPDSSPH